MINRLEYKAINHINIKVIRKIWPFSPRWFFAGSPIFCENFKAISVFKRAFLGANKLNCLVTGHL